MAESFEDIQIKTKEAPTSAVPTEQPEESKEINLKKVQSLEEDK